MSRSITRSHYLNIFTLHISAAQLTRNQVTNGRGVEKLYCTHTWNFRGESYLRTSVSCWSYHRSSLDTTWCQDRFLVGDCASLRAYSWGFNNLKWGIRAGLPFQKVPIFTIYHNKSTNTQHSPPRFTLSLDRGQLEKRCRYLESPEIITNQRNR